VLCNHIHLPVQSGSSRVLKAMLREYTREEYQRRISWIKSARRDISVTTDVIVGFPGETEADFEDTLALLTEVGYDSLFSFKYSPRPNTPALQYSDSIPDEEKGRRLAELQERQKSISTTRNARHLNEICDVLVEGRNEIRGQWIGRTSQNKVLNFTVPVSSGTNVRPGDYVDVRVTGTFPNSLVGELVAEGQRR
jgi:tRNA-2-methylthio-N6-dimethylallyladenosine synthase